MEGIFFSDPPSPPFIIKRRMRTTGEAGWKRMRSSDESGGRDWGKTERLSPRPPPSW